jgi:hypothetical protein
VRNRESIERLGGPSPDGVVRFVVAGDSGAWPDPTADAIFAALLEQVGRLDPRPTFFANLGDFAGPGTRERHERYLGLVAGLPLPSLCVVGNHDLDDSAGAEVFREVHGPPNFTFAVGHTRFVAIDAAPGSVGEVVIEEPLEGVEGPREEALAYLEEQLALADEPNRVVLMHIPPFLEGRFAPHANWGLRQREERFLEIVRAGGVRLVCAAHGLAFDTCQVDGIRFVMSGGGGTGLCSHLRGICAEGEGHPEDRGALFHCVELSVAADGVVSGRALQAFGGERFRF